MGDGAWRFGAGQNNPRNDGRSDGRRAGFAGLVVKQATPTSAKRFCHRQTAGRLTPARRATSNTGNRSPEKRTILARCTCLKGRLRSATICFRRSVSVEFRRMLTVWAMTAGVSGFSCKGRFHQFSLNLSSNRIANWALAIVHSRGGILHSFCARFNTRKSSFSALSSVGKCPRARTARRSFAFKDSIAFVV